MMSNLTPENDLRATKIERILMEKLLFFLDKRSFQNITVNDICKEALCSRATFYTHFNSKYDLLKYWMQDIETNIPENIFICNEFNIINELNNFILTHKKIIKNIFKEHDEMVLDLLQKFLESVNKKVSINTTHKLLSKRKLRFGAGGILNLIKGQIKDSFSNEDFIDMEIYHVFKYMIVQDS